MITIQLSNGYNNNDNILQIVNILGGIDKILSDYLNKEKNNLVISDSKLTKLNQLLTKPLTPLTKMGNNNKNNDGENQYDDKYNFSYDFMENDTYLHSFLDDQRAKKILNILHSRGVQILEFLAITIWAILFFLMNNSIIYIIYVSIICCTAAVWIPYLLCWLLSSNRMAFKLITGSFEFWFKVGYGLQFGILVFIQSYKYYESEIFIISMTLFKIICIPLLIAYISAFDAVQTNAVWKTLISGACALWFLSDSITYQFILQKEHDYMIYIPITNVSLSCLSMMASTTRILSIFLFKQCYFSLSRKGKRCALIRYAPYINWSRNEKEQNVDVNNMDDIDEDRGKAEIIIAGTQEMHHIVTNDDDERL